MTSHEWLNLSAPLNDNGDFDRCNIFNISFDDAIQVRPGEGYPTIPCTMWEFSEEMFQVNFLLEQDLIKTGFMTANQNSFV